MVLMGFAWTIVAMIAVLAVAWRFLGSYMAAVFEVRVRWLSWAERPVYRLLGVDPESEQSWRATARR
jgi:potassium-transporting ATPase potassium-binding subunit